MIEQLLACAHCSGNPRIGRSQRFATPQSERKYDYRIFGDLGDNGPPRNGDHLPRPPEMPTVVQLRKIYCIDCEMGTEWEEVRDGESEYAALERVGARWNTRVGRPTYEHDDVRALINKEIGAPDMQLIISIMAATTQNWEERGPILQALAQRLSDATETSRDIWPIEPTLKDAARFRKLAQLVKMVYVDDEPFIQFPCIAAKLEYRELAWEDRVANSVDDLPDRDRW